MSAAAASFEDAVRRAKPKVVACPYMHVPCDVWRQHVFPMLGYVYLFQCDRGALLRGRGVRRADGLRRLCSVFADALADEEVFAASLPLRARFTSTGNLFVQVPSPSYPTFRSAVRVVNAYTKNILANPHYWSKAPLSCPPVLELRVAAGKYDLFQERSEDCVDPYYEADWGGHSVCIMAANLHIRGVAREVNGKTIRSALTNGAMNIHMTFPTSCLRMEKFHISNQHGSGITVIGTEQSSSKTSVEIRHCVVARTAMHGIDVHHLMESRVSLFRCFVHNAACIGVQVRQSRVAMKECIVQMCGRNRHLSNSGSLGVSVSGEETCLTLDDCVVRLCGISFGYLHRTGGIRCDLGAALTVKGEHSRVYKNLGFGIGAWGSKTKVHVMLGNATQPAKVTPGQLSFTEGMSRAAMLSISSSGNSNVLYINRSKQNGLFWHEMHAPLALSSKRQGFWSTNFVGDVFVGAECAPNIVWCADKSISTAPSM